VRRPVFVALVALLLAPVAARAADPVRLTIGVVGEIGSIDLTDGTTPAAAEIWRLQYPTLTTYDLETLAPIPGLAEAWTPTADGTGYTYNLRDATWSDGQPVTAADVVYSLTRARDEDWPYAGGRFAGLDVVAVDDRTVTITAAGESALPALALHVVPQHLFETGTDADAAGLVGAGDWHVVERSEAEVRLQVVDRPGRPALDEIVFRDYSDADALRGALGDGDVDVAAGFAASDYPPLHSIDGATPLHANDGDQWVLQIRAEEPAARQAIARAIDRDALVQSVVDGAGRAQTIPIVARDAAWVPPADDLDLAYAPERARELLEGAQAVPTLTLGAPAGDVGDAIADAVIADLEAIGMTVERDDDQPDLTVSLRDPTDDPTVALAAYTCAGGDVFCDAQYEESFARFSEARDTPTRQTLAHEMVRQLAGEGVEVVLFAPDDVQAFRTDNVIGLLQPPDDVRLVTMWPSVAQYRDVTPARARASEELPTRTFVVLAIGVFALAAGAAVVVEVIRRRSRPPVDGDVEPAVTGEGVAGERGPT
jgi:peptide/nickel transport system substrate-binding protein